MTCCAHTAASVSASVPVSHRSASGDNQWVNISFTVYYRI